jgi:hypothetical protein
MRVRIRLMSIPQLTYDGFTPHSRNRRRDCDVIDCAMPWSSRQ